MYCVAPVITPIQWLPAASFNGAVKGSLYQPAALLLAKVNWVVVACSPAGFPLESA